MPFYVHFKFISSPLALVIHVNYGPFLLLFGLFFNTFCLILLNSRIQMYFGVLLCFYKLFFLLIFLHNLIAKLFILGRTNKLLAIVWVLEAMWGKSFKKADIKREELWNGAKWVKRRYITLSLLQVRGEKSP